MGGAGNSGQEPGSQVAVTGGGTTPLAPAWATDGVPGNNPGVGSGGVPPLVEEAVGLRPYELQTASTGTDPSTGLLSGPIGGSGASQVFAGASNGGGFNHDPSPTKVRYDNVDAGKVPPTTVAAPAPPPPPPAPPPAPTDPWAGRVQIFGSGAEGFGTDTSAQWLARWPSQAQAEQRPGTDNWYLPVGVAR